jgi:hypothetical protein
MSRAKAAQGTVKEFSGSMATYDRKLEKVMERLGVSNYNWNHDRHGGWVEFTYKQELYRFDYSIYRAKERGIILRRGTDAFAMLILGLEDLARLVERGLYDLQTWIRGMKALPAPTLIPEYFRALGFTEVPASVDDVEARFRKLAAAMHPDQGGNAPDFRAVVDARRQAREHFGVQPQANAEGPGR